MPLEATGLKALLAHLDFGVVLHDHPYVSSSHRSMAALAAAISRAAAEIQTLGDLPAAGAAAAGCSFTVFLPSGPWVLSTAM